MVSSVLLTCPSLPFPPVGFLHVAFVLAVPQILSSHFFHAPSSRVFESLTSFSVDLLEIKARLVLFVGGLSLICPYVAASLSSVALFPSPFPLCRRFSTVLSVPLLSFRPFLPPPQQFHVPFLHPRFLSRRGHIIRSPIACHLPLFRGTRFFTFPILSDPPLPQSSPTFMRSGPSPLVEVRLSVISQPCLSHARPHAFQACQSFAVLSFFFICSQQLSVLLSDRWLGHQSYAVSCTADFSCW